MIKHIAQIVGPSHSVDLKNYDLLILVDIYRNILGMSVVGGDYDELKKFNLAEIYDPTPQPQSGKAGNAKVDSIGLGTSKHEKASLADIAENQDAANDEKPSTTRATVTDALHSAEAELDKAVSDAVGTNA